MVAKALYTQPMLPNTCPTTLSQGRNIHVNNSLSCFAPTNVVCRLHRGHCHAIRTSLNATESSHQPQSAEELQHELQDAISVENYEKAAELRDALKSLQPSDSAPALKKKMDQLVSQDNFEEAAAVRDQLRAVVQQNIEEAQKRTTSDVVTEGVRVRVKSYFVPNQSYPDQRQFFFAYAVTISNEGSDTVQLLNRHWVIHNAEGQKQEVRGPGVVGETPVLKPGDVYEYTSACPLSTPTGSMKGDFEMIKVDSSEPGSTEPQRFLAEVAQFGLDMQQAMLA